MLVADNVCGCVDGCCARCPIGAADLSLDAGGKKGRQTRGMSLPSPVN